MHDDAEVRTAARRCLDEGGPWIAMARTDRYSGAQMVDPTIHSLAHFGGHSRREFIDLEEQIVRDAFQAFRATYISALEELIAGEPEPEKQPQVSSGSKAVW